MRTDLLVEPEAAARSLAAAIPAPTRSEPEPDVESRVLGFGTAIPAHEFTQAELAEWLARGCEEREARLVRAAFRGSGIERRASCLPDFSASCTAPRLFRGGSPTTAERMEVYRLEAPALAREAAARAITAAGVSSNEVTHLFLVSCTGFAAPGPDVDLIESLGLPRGVRRVLFGFQGCSAGLAALRAAAETVRGESSACVLVVAVELSSLHFQPRLDPGDVRGHALFADGAGAAIVGGAARRGGEVGEPGRPTVVLERGCSVLLPETRDRMTWTVTDHGFVMRLGSDVPELFSAAAPELVGQAAGQGAPFLDWVVHPGGPAVLDRLAESLALDARDLEPSRAVLRRHGNMSSATIFFVFAELLRRTRERVERGAASGADRSASRRGLALAFGPGLLAEGLGFRVLGCPE